MRLRVLRAERGLTLRQVESATGVTKESLSEIERGARHPYDITLAKLAKFYDVPLEELLEDQSPLVQAPPETAEGEERRLREEAQRLGEEAFSNLPVADRIERLSVWLDRLQRLRDRRTLDLKPVREGEAPLGYGVWLEMYALDRWWQKLFEEEGVHTHYERAMSGVLEVSPEERALCQNVAEAQRDVNDLTNKARELEAEALARIAPDVARGLADFEKDLGLEQTTRP
jgi:transcriptional regulator with XRE-family HTH domain